jgi:hypothetical protein
MIAYGVHHKHKGLYGLFLVKRKVVAPFVESDLIIWMILTPALDGVNKGRSHQQSPAW